MDDEPIGEPDFPPLFRGEAAGIGADPFAKAIAAATIGVDPGLIVYQLEPERLRAAMVLTPETSLEDAMAMTFAASLGFGDALGVLAPPEVGLHFDWPAGLRVNGAKCGKIELAASTNDPTVEPDWLVIGLELTIFPSDGDLEPGEDPDRTSLVEEGCGEVSPPRLLENWVRHTLVWINSWLADGMAPLHADWRSRAYSMGDEISFTLNGTDYSGTFVGIDEKGGLLLRNGDTTDLLPLTTILKGN